MITRFEKTIFFTQEEKDKYNEDLYKMIKTVKTKQSELDDAKSEFAAVKKTLENDILKLNKEQIELVETIELGYKTEKVDSVEFVDNASFCHQIIVQKSNGEFLNYRELKNYQPRIDYDEFNVPIVKSRSDLYDLILNFNYFYGEKPINTFTVKINESFEYEYFVFKSSNDDIRIIRSEKDAFETESSFNLTMEIIESVIEEVKVEIRDNPDKYQSDEMNDDPDNILPFPAVGETEFVEETDDETDEDESSEETEYNFDTETEPD